MTTSPQIKNAGTPPAWNGNDILLRATGADPYGIIFGGTMGVFDFALPSQIDAMVNGDEVPNLRTGYDPVVCLTQNGNGSSKLSGAIAAKGLPFEYDDTESVSLPLTAGKRNFDLLSLGDEPSVVIWFWATHTDPQPSTSNTGSILGYGSGNSNLFQWGAIMRAGDDQIRCALGASGAVNSVDFTPTKGEPVLTTLYYKRTAEGICTLYVYENDVLKGSTSRAYPFNDPASSGQVPKIGILAGYGGTYDGTVHRVGGQQVNPDIFDIDAWLAAEIASAPAGDRLVPA